MGPNIDVERDEAVGQQLSLRVAEIRQNLAALRLGEQGRGPVEDFLHDVVPDRIRDVDPRPPGLRLARFRAGGRR
jgi:hypothetical protein